MERETVTQQRDDLVAALRQLCERLGPRWFLEQGWADPLAVLERVEATIATEQQTPAPTDSSDAEQLLPYCEEVGTAGEKYHESFPYAHPLPQTWRWNSLWDAMQAAAYQVHANVSQQRGVGQDERSPQNGSLSQEGQGSAD